MCGIFAVFGARKAAELTVIGLHGNQHRAIEFAGIASSDGTNIFREVGPGLARQVFADSDKINRLHGQHAVGHIRYSTAQKQEDDKYRDNIHPVIGWYQGKKFALVHNGNLTNVDELSNLLNSRTMETRLDTEYIVRLIEKFDTGKLVADLTKVFGLLKGSYSLGILFPECLVAVRDISGNRPLSLGKLGEGYFISSETCGFSGLGVEFVRDIDPGQIVCIEASGIRSWPFAEPKERMCRFEHIYFSLPTSLTFGEPVIDFRKRLGRMLEVHYPAPGADIVIPVPDSARFIAMGYAESGRSGHYDEPIVRSHYVGRTFIAADQAKRDAEVAQKFTFAPHAIEGKKIVVVDDSIVRGTTLPKIVGELRRYGAKEVHVRIGSPPIKHPCLYGINTPTQQELMSFTHKTAEICAKVGADSLQFLPLSALEELAPYPDNFCYACIDGKYWH